MKHTIPQFRLGLALVLASLAGQALAQSSPLQVAGSGWQALTTMAPAVAASRTTKYVAWVGQTGNQIWFSAYNGTSWTKQQVVGGTGWTALTSNAPALAWDFRKNLLWLAWEGNGSNDIWYSTWDGTSWATQDTVGGSGWTAETYSRPSLGFTGDNMYLAWKGATDNQIYYTYWNYPDWTAQTIVSNLGWTAETASGPALDPGTQGPIIFWRGTGAGQHLWLSILESGGWSSQEEISCTLPPFNPATDTSPAAMELINGLLIIPIVDVVFWKDSSSTALMYSDDEGAVGGCIFSPPVSVSGSGWSAQTDVAPSASTAQTYSNANSTVLGWKNATDHTIYILDPTTLPGLKGY